MAKAPSGLPRFKVVERHIRDAANAGRAAVEEIDSALPAARRDSDRKAQTEVRNLMSQTRQGLLDTMGTLFDQIRD